MVKIVYSILLGVMLAVFVGVGIETFYPGPKMPEYPTDLTYTKATPDTYSDEEISIQNNYDNQQKDWQKKDSAYSRNLSIIALIASIVLMALSLTVLTKMTVFDNGFLIGSLLTLLYGITRGFAGSGEDYKFRFFLITIGLIVAMALGYLKFIVKKELVDEK